MEQVPNTFPSLFAAYSFIWGYSLHIHFLLRPSPKKAGKKTVAKERVFRWSNER